MLTVLIVLLVVFTFEVVSTGIMFRQLYRRVHMMSVWIAAIDEVQDWQLEEQLKNEDFKQAVTLALGSVRLALGNPVGISTDGRNKQPCWEPSIDNPNSYYDAAEWHTYHKANPEAIRCYEPAHEQRGYWTSSFDGDPDTSDPSRRRERGADSPAEQRSGDVGE